MIRRWKRWGRLARAVDGDKINRTLDGAEKFASALGRNAEDVDRAIRDITAKSGTITRALDRLDNVMAGAESFFGGGQDGATAGLIRELTDAAKSIQTLAGNLDAVRGNSQVASRASLGRASAISRRLPRIAGRP